jgi:hypothetical protein
MHCASFQLKTFTKPKMQTMFMKDKALLLREAGLSPCFNFHN